MGYIPEKCDLQWNSDLFLNVYTNFRLSTDEKFEILQIAFKQNIQEYRTVAFNQDIAEIVTHLLSFGPPSIKNDSFLKK